MADTKVRMCFPKTTFARPPVPGARPTPDGQRWCCVFQPKSLAYAMRSGGADPTVVTDEAVERNFAEDFPGWDECTDCPFPPA